MTSGKPMHPRNKQIHQLALQKSNSSGNNRRDTIQILFLCILKCFWPFRISAKRYGFFTTPLSTEVLALFYQNETQSILNLCSRSNRLMGVILPQSYKDIFKEAKFYNHHNCVGLLREIQAWYLSSALHSLNITQQHQHTHSGSRSSDSNQSATTTRPTVYLTPLLQLTDQSGINGA